MSTVQVEESVKRKLFSYAAKLQAQSGRKVSLSEAIDRLLQKQQSLEDAEDMVDKAKILSLFGILRGSEKPARRVLRELRDEEERSIGERYARASRKYSA
jgi:hypothetical protein